MFNLNLNSMKKVILLAVFVIAATTVIFAQKKEKHPAYLHALSDLRAARWMIEHRPGNWQQTTDEVEAVKKIDGAINEIKQASIDDGEDIDYILKLMKYLTISVVCIKQQIFLKRQKKT